MSDLFERFKQVCGNCHGPAVDPPGLGGFQIRSDNDFSTGMTLRELKHIKSDGPTVQGNPAQDPFDPMPPLSGPTGAPFSKRAPSDPVKQFADLVAAWLTAGSPQSFSLASSSGMVGGVDSGFEGGSAPSSPYLMSPLAGDTMTNIGHCVPTRTLVAIEHDRSAQLDAMFAGLTKLPPGPGVTAAQSVGLPERLADTDLFTLDTAELARYGVVAFQPTYPLWSDNAGKLRYVRVPRGTSIKFNKDTQEFTIPPNTRFYKTFLKKIVDTDGSIRYRKIETRLIVARPDQSNGDGTSAVTALFGSYQWNAGETDATLIVTPLRNGLPFADTLTQYTTDEQLAAAILATKPLRPLEALLEGGAARHYAVPSSERCVQCHMGSNSASFVLGFRPVQIKRRAAGEGGILVEPDQTAPGPDELTQLQRFIDYGLITGLDSPDDIFPLEQAEGSRTPRNDYELSAQGYMVGNCTHCHNPRGFPSVTNPVLADTLNFLPGPKGGVFQFPLERYSPRIGRGLGQKLPIPYITPSLMDRPSAEWNTGGAGNFDDDWNLATVSQAGVQVNYILYAPWRSLIFRNVETPFAYEDNLALFPHMPMNAPGFDCRAKQIMSDWMVSIPAIRKDPEKPEYAFADAPGKVHGGAVVDDNDQPYVEVLPGAPQYADALRAADARLQILHTGINPSVALAPDGGGAAYSVYSYCPDTTDILDPAVTLDPVCHPVPTTESQPPLALVTPARPHWVNTDLTQAPQAPGMFSVRRPDWAQVVAQQTFLPPAPPCHGTLQDAINTQNEVKKTVALLQGVSLDDKFRAWATTAVPFGLWAKKPGCSYPMVPTVDSFAADKRPLWMAHTNPAPKDPMYMASPGAAIFGMICINCHGPNIDSRGRLSDNLATMTGGNAIVANFRDGLFGPLESPGLHRKEAFADKQLPTGLGPNWTGASVDDRAARYLSWMALGGTEVQIPLSILTVVGDTRVLGVHRALPQSAISANMLSAAKAICMSLLANPFGGGIRFDASAGWFQATKDQEHLDSFPLLIASNGDAELWMKLCSLNNPPPVRQLYPWEPDPPFRNIAGATSLLTDPTIYGTGPVGNELGQIDATLTGYGADVASPNLFPWCIESADSAGAKKADALAFIAQNKLPVCPDCGTDKCWTSDRQDEWATRGAINAGLAVYTYVDSLVTNLSQGKPPTPSYDQCDKLR